MEGRHEPFSRNATASSPLPANVAPPSVELLAKKN
jgi:hypothetical protein